LVELIGLVGMLELVDVLVMLGELDVAHLMVSTA
jgi:hypothetical protein